MDETGFIRVGKGELWSDIPRLQRAVVNYIVPAVMNPSACSSHILVVRRESERMTAFGRDLPGLN